MDIISIKEKMTKESNKRRPRPKTFCSGFGKNNLDWLQKKLLQNFPVLFVQGRNNCFFYKVLILLGCRSRSQSMRGLKQKKIFLE